MAGEKDSVIHTTSGSLFSPEQTGELFNKVKGHSALAKLSAQKPIPFSGTDTFVFSMDGEAAIVAEGANKPAGKASFDKVTIKPLKFVYQHRLTEEFVNMADEKQLPYLQAFLDGFAKKMARALDIAAMHGIDPNSKTTAAAIGSNCLDSAVPTASVIAGTDNPAADLQSAVDAVQNLDCEVTGMAMSPKFAASMGKMKQTSTSNVVLYPEFAFGSRPDSFNGMGVDVNNTVSFNASTMESAVNRIPRIAGVIPSHWACKSVPRRIPRIAGVIPWIWEKLKDNLSIPRIAGVIPGKVRWQLSRISIPRIAGVILPGLQRNKRRPRIPRIAGVIRIIYCFWISSGSIPRIAGVILHE